MSLEATLLLILSPRALASGVFAMLLNKLFILFHLIYFALVLKNLCICQCCIFNVSCLIVVQDRVWICREVLVVFFYSLLHSLLLCLLFIIIIINYYYY